MEEINKTMDEFPQNPCIFKREIKNIRNSLINTENAFEIYIKTPSVEGVYNLLIPVYSRVDN